MTDWDTWILDSDTPDLPLHKWQQSLDLATRLFKAPVGYVMQYTSRGGQVVAASGRGSLAYPIGSYIPVDAPTFSAEVVRQKRQLYVPDAQVDHRWELNPEVTSDGIRSFFGLPLFWPDGMAFGTLCVMDSVPTDYREPFLELMNTFRELLESDLQLLVSDRELDELTLTDAMTGIYNRRGFDTLAEHKLSVAKRYGHTFGLMYFDLDNLSTINEQLGVETGDKAICALAEALAGELRDSDVAARIGSDEFAALVFVKKEDDLGNLAIRIQRRLNLLKRRCDSMPPLTTSVGAKCYQADTSLDIKAMLNEVDRLMYNIKQQKRLTRAPGHIPHH
ncbi:sensor domain-containing diguanylate cyclase [Motiliproteus sp. SC1-56]|uniref:sensor domain-containing diguanylate cyclase n=1 Tax=Motiliproteus sp. SC1-56 TaxID=2799565 RepID=UPI001A8FB627|nr:sensor domain-containing diguanylate cyclase [Motiliproteus sp. SC1-56]